ncbi:MAG TPA: HAD family phosphatase [Planctomycetaceae bacterium]|nr:HAD family phosphatase [Planctomycetaceae bacterium]
MPIRTCFFDMGNVLVRFSHEKMCENVAAVCRTDLASVTQLLISNELQFQLECGKITEEEFHAAVERELECSVDPSELKVAVSDIFELNESIVPLLEELRALSVRLVLLSNTSVTHLNFIRERFEVLEYFDDLTTSFAAGALKPDSAIYEHALGRADAAPSECFFTDDIEAYVVAARAFGIHAEVYTETSLTRRQLRSLGVKISE